MADCDFHYRIVVNKHYREASGVTIDSFVKRGENADYVLRDDITGESYIDGRGRDFTDEGEIIISNEKMAEGIYILSYDPETERKTPIRVTGAESIRIPHVDDTSSAEVNRMVGDSEFEIPNNSTVQGAVSLLDSHVKETDERISTRVGNLENRVDQVEEDRIREDEDIKDRLNVLEGLEIEAISLAEDSGLLASYRLVDSNGEQRGAYINIPPMVKNVYLEDLIIEGRNVQNLVLVIPTIDGGTSETRIPISNILTEGEFKDGLEVNNTGEVRVKIDDTSENYLTVSENGLKIDGIYNNITGYTTNAIGNLNTGITSNTNSGISVEIGEHAGLLTGATVNVVPGEVEDGVTGLTTGGKVFNAIEGVKDNVQTQLDTFRDVTIGERTTEIFNEKFGEEPYALRISYVGTASNPDDKKIRLVYRKPADNEQGYIEMPMQEGVKLDEVVSSGLKSAEVIEITNEEGEDYDGVHYAQHQHVLKLVYITTNGEEVVIYRNISVMYDALVVLSEDEYQQMVENDEIDENKFYYTYEE